MAEAMEESDAAEVLEKGDKPDSTANNKGSSEGLSNSGEEVQDAMAKDIPPRSSSKPHLQLDMDGPHKPENLDHHPADDLHGPDSPTTSLIESLRAQLSILSEQSEQLNTKLIASISRHADLEDQHFQLQEQHRNLATKAEGLEKDKKQYEESMNTGLLVERSQISAEMQKLAAGLVEEERKRGSAEERRKQVESEVDDLSASLFDQANTMVAQERHGRIEAEERLKSAEENLAVAEAAVRDMQLHLQSMPTSSRSPPTAAPARTSIPRQYLASHVPYTEYISFLAHLRSLRPLKETSKNLFPPPQVINLLAQPFLARVSAEDHDPTLRLDIAPDISWLSRKGVNQAVIAGELIIEPVSASTVVAGSSNAIQDIGCSLCGKPVFPATQPPASPAASNFGPPPIHPTQRSSSSSRFSLKPFFNSTSPNPTGNTASPTSSPLASPGPTLPAMASLGSVYIFRVNKPPPTNGAAPENPRLYPLCKTGWCLERLRATCELWHFVRTGIVHVVWHGDDGFVLASESGSLAVAGDPHTPNTQAGAADRSTPTLLAEVEPAPDMNRKKSGAWGLGFKLADKAPSGWAKAWNRSSTGTSSLNVGAAAAGAGSPPISPRMLPPANGERKESASSIVEEKESQGETIEDAPEKVREGITALPGQIDEKEETQMDEAPTAKEVSSEKEEEMSAPTEEKDVEEAKSTAPEEEEDDLLASLQAQLEADSPPRPRLKKKLGAPLELDSDVPAITEITPTPSAPTADAIPDPLDVPASELARKDSSTSLKSSGTDEFATPKEEQRDLVPESLSPMEPTSADQGEGGGSLDTPKKPPVPKRSAGRTPRPNGDVSGGSTPAERSRSTSPAPPSTKPVGPRLPARRSVDARRSIDSRRSIDAAAATATVPQVNEEKKDQPPLPPRHPHTPNAQITVALSMAPDGEKAWIKEDAEESWEVKTWKQIIRLKEEMWKRRIGVVDRDED